MSGGGALSVLQNDKCMKINNYPKITGHLGDVQDFDFSPFKQGKISKIRVNSHRFR